MEAKTLEIEKEYSYEDYLQLDATAKERLELIFGKIYMMAGASAVHQDVVLNIAVTLREDEKCKPRVAPYDLKLFCPVANRERINVVQPDVMLFCESEQLPCAIFEVLSPSTAAKDKTIKKDLYACAGIKEYFVVEPEYMIVEKFELVDKEYRYVGSFTKDDKLAIGCIDKEVAVERFFEGIESEAK